MDVGLHADHAVPIADGLRGPIVVGGHDGEFVEVVEVLR